MADNEMLRTTEPPGLPVVEDRLSEEVAGATRLKAADWELVPSVAVTVAL